LGKGIAVIKYAILGLLHYKDMHGYRIKEHIDRNFGYMWSINYGQIYPNLKSLQEDGLIRMTEEPQNGEKGPPRKLCSITPEGREEFSRWLASPPEKPMIMRDPFLMRFVFFGFGDPETSLAIIDQQIARYKKELVRRKKNLKRWEKSGVHVRLMAELGADLNEMLLKWLTRSRDEIQKQVQTKEGETSS
jgi:DNA-binding PadR family transcriptional regulator